MKYTNYILLLLFLVSSEYVLGQNLTNDAVPILHVKKLDSYQNDQAFNSTLFNFNEYEQINVDEFKKVFGLEDSKKYSVFVVLSHNDTPELFQVSSEEGIVQVSPTMIESKIDIPIEVQSGSSHYVYYGGPSGKIMKEVEASKVNIGSREQVSGTGVINVAEVIVFDQVFDKEKLSILQSRLAIKYGISLPTDSIYVNSEGFDIFDPKEHGAYIHNVVAIGNDEDLNVLQAVHHEDQTLQIGVRKIHPLNEKNHNIIPYKSYMFLGENKGKMSFDSGVLDRKWKVSINHYDYLDFPFQVKVDKRKFNDFDNRFDYFIASNTEENFDEGQAEFFEMSVIGDYLVADGFFLREKNTQYFTITRIPKQLSVSTELTMKVNNLQTTGRTIRLELTAEKGLLNGQIHLFTVDGYLLNSIQLDETQSYTQDYNLEQAGIYFLRYREGPKELIEKIIIQ